MIIDYNNYMGGVDLTDQYLSYYSMTTRQTLKWWKKVFWRLLDITIVNSWILFRTNYLDHLSTPTKVLITTCRGVGPAFVGSSC